MTQFIESIVHELGLIAHPEGGFFKEVFRSKDRVASTSPRYGEETRSASTTIYYLLGGNDFSAWHRVKSDEIWHFCSGASLTLYVITHDRKIKEIKIGDPFQEPDAQYHYSVESGQWFCAASNDPEGYTLVSCIVTPGFEYKDWEMADRETLTQEYPEHEEIILRFTREDTIST